MIKRAQEWFLQKDPREQRLLLALLVCSVIILFWFGLFQPLKQATETMQTRFGKVQRDLLWLQKQVSAAALLPEKTPSGSMENQVKSSLHLLDSAVKIQRADSGELTISADAIRMEAFMNWLAVVQGDYGLRIVELEFHASKRDADSITLTRLTLGAKNNG